MSRLEQARFEASLDRPLLIFKAGILGCAPLDLMDELADSYGAAFFSSDETRADLMAGREGQDIEDAAPHQARRISTRVIQDRVLKGARGALNDEKDVVIDMFFNTPGSRRKPIKLAQEAGAMTIALHAHAPFSLIRKRVKEWTKKGDFLIPAKDWEVPPIVAAQKMMYQVDRPSQHEGIDYVFNLDGTGSTEEILEKYEADLEACGLLARYEDVAA